MSGDKDAGGAKALVEFKDLLGLSAAAKVLAEGIVQGVGTLAALYLGPRQDRIERERFSGWAELLTSRGVPIEHADVELGERAVVRLTADALRHQYNREKVAQAAIADWMEGGAGSESNTDSTLNSDTWNFDWLDRFWRLAECSNDEKMQSLWGRVLSRRATGLLNPNPRILEYISLMGAEEIAQIEKIAPFVLRSSWGDGTLNSGIIQSISPTDITRFILDKKIIDSENINISKIVGNIRSDMLGPTGFYIQSGWAHTFTFPYKDGAYHFDLSGFTCKLFGPEVRAHSQFCTGEGLSPLGDQIVRLVSFEPNADFIDTFISAWKKLGYEIELTKIT